MRVQAVLTVNSAIYFKPKQKGAFKDDKFVGLSEADICQDL